VDRAGSDRIPEFNKQQAPTGSVDLSAMTSLGLGGHRTKLEVFVIVLVAVIIIGGTLPTFCCW
jgi:hypothetical protein